MNDAGYTLVDTLVALAVLALVIGGLSAGLQLLAGRQRAVTQAVQATAATRSVQARLDRLVGPGLYRSGDPTLLTGDAAGFHYACGQAEPCRVSISAAAPALIFMDAAGMRQLALGTKDPVAFSYRGSDGGSPTWPPAAPRRQSLRGISLVSRRDGRAVLSTRVWREQPAACGFDPVLQDCR